MELLLCLGKPLMECCVTARHPCTSTSTSVCVWPGGERARVTAASFGVGGAQASRLWSSTTCATRRTPCVNWTVRESSALLSRASTPPTPLLLHPLQQPASSERRQPRQPTCKPHLRIHHSICTASALHLHCIFSCSRRLQSLHFRAARQPVVYTVEVSSASSAATRQRPSSHPSPRLPCQPACDTTNPPGAWVVSVRSLPHPPSPTPLYYSITLSHTDG